MARALELAVEGRGLASPNPMVGAVVVGPGGDIAGQGWHEGPGTPHAEIVALHQAGDRARGATLYTTLEPCSHQGRTGPCAQAVRDAGVARVVAAVLDPNPVVDGRGIRILRDGGVEVTEGVLQDAARELMAGFLKHVTTGLPFVVLKMAASLDGRTAARDGSSRWITGPDAREDVQRLRALADAVVVGAGTVVADDPSLTVRIDGYLGRPPLRVLVDGRGTVSPPGKIFDAQAPTLVATTRAAPGEARSAWEAAGADLLVDGDVPGDGRVDLSWLMASLGKRDLQTVLIEGGPTLAWSAVAAGVVDRLVLYLAPKLVGGSEAPGVLGGGGVASVAGALGVEVRSVERIGSDLKVVADVHRDR
jgi:diaminohydroxyphosphoribosylaminopyrimidine deaminase / 5-amino-6-(5-phosphoribosylamino)uracil reductase